MSERTTLEGLVCQNKMQEAIDQLKTLIQDLSKEPLNNLIALSGRFSAVSHAENAGTAPIDLTETENNRIRAAFLSILSDVREEVQSKINFFKPIPRAVKDRDTLRDFIDTVLSRKFCDIAPFSEGNSFIYFNAKERHSDQDVMIMVLKSSDIEDIKRNSQLNRISQLKHRNLIQLLDVNFQAYPYYIITEFVSGVNLKTLMATTGAFPLHNAKRLLLIIGDVMNYLRQKKFAHSGIRPSKIIIDKELEPEISPFDILKVSDSKRLASSYLEDSYYFAPERLHEIKDNSAEATDKSNQFCLAVLAYEMLTGEKLFAGSNLSETLLARHRFFNDPEFRKARLAHPRLPARMAAILKKMLQETPAKRYDDLVTALQEIARVRSVLDENEEKVFSSYRRCLNHSDDFIKRFYEKLFSEPDMKETRPQTKKEQEELFQKFHITVHLLFDVENAVSFMERIARLSPDKKNTATKYGLFLKVFTETVAECDPRWNHSPSTANAWNHLKDRIIDTLAAFLPEHEAETPAESETPAAAAPDADPEEGGPDLSFPTVPEELRNGENGAEAGDTAIDAVFDPEKA